MTEIALTPLDESFTHQAVAPALKTTHVHPAWAERCYHLLHVDDDTTLAAGRAIYPHGGRRTGLTGVATAEAEHCLRLEEPFSPGDDPNRPDVGPLRIESVQPLQEVRLILDDPGLPFSYDLTYRARFPAVPTDPNRIEREGEVVTDYMNFFQSGHYSGSVVVDGREHQLRDRLGFRDRGWGLRKHEGAARRGMHVFCGAELPDRSVYVLLYETASGRRAFTNGWIIEDGGVSDHVTGAEHDLAWSNEHLLTGGTVELRFASGRTGSMDIEVENIIFLAGIGYTRDPAHKGPGFESFDLTDRHVIAELEGQNDNGARFRFDGEEGYGYVETGLGVHARYRPEQEATAQSTPRQGKDRT